MNEKFESMRKMLSELLDGFTKLEAIYKEFDALSHQYRIAFLELELKLNLLAVDLKELE